MFSFNVFAEGELPTTLTLKATKEGTAISVDTESITAVSEGEEFVASVLLDSTSGLKTLGLKITYDPNDIVLGTSATADEAIELYSELVGIEGGFATEAEMILGMTGKKAFVDDTYNTVYASYDASTPKKGISNASIVEKESEGTVMFSYARDAAMSTVPVLVTKNMHVAGTVLKVNTTEKKQTQITITEATASGSAGKDTPCTIANTITLNLNGYGEVVEPEVPKAADYGLFTDASQNFKVDAPVMTSNKYAIEKALGFVSGINKDVKLACGTEITCEGSDKVLDIPAENFYVASELVNGFVAAVTSIRDTNLDKEFSAKAYVIVDGVKVYAEETATAVYGK